MGSEAGFHLWINVGGCPRLQSSPSRRAKFEVQSFFLVGLMSFFFSFYMVRTRSGRELGMEGTKVPDVPTSVFERSSLWSTAAWSANAGRQHWACQPVFYIFVMATLCKYIFSWLKKAPQHYLNEFSPTLWHLSLPPHDMYWHLCPSLLFSCFSVLEMHLLHIHHVVALWTSLIWGFCLFFILELSPAFLFISSHHLLVNDRNSPGDPLDQLGFPITLLGNPVVQISSNVPGKQSELRSNHWMFFMSHVWCENICVTSLIHSVHSAEFRRPGNWRFKTPTKLSLHRRYTRELNNLSQTFSWKVMYSLLSFFFNLLLFQEGHLTNWNRLLGATTIPFYHNFKTDKCLEQLGPTCRLTISSVGACCWRWSWQWRVIRNQSRWTSRVLLPSLCPLWILCLVGVVASFWTLRLLFANQGRQS